MQTCSDSMRASAITRKAGKTRSNESGKLIPSRRGHDIHVAACGSHSAGMRYPNCAGVTIRGGSVSGISINESATKVAISVNATIAQERPMRALHVELREIDFREENLFA